MRYYDMLHISWVAGSLLELLADLHAKENLKISNIEQVEILYITVYSI